MAKKIWIQLMALLLVFSNIGCGASKEEETKPTSSKPAQVETSIPEDVAVDDASIENNSEEIIESSNDSSNEPEIDAMNEFQEDNSNAVETDALDEFQEGNSNNTEIDSTLLVDHSIEAAKEEELNVGQKKSIAMLNYLAVLSQEINSSKNSRMFLEEAYAALINNTNPEGVNELTESHLASLLDIIEKYRMITVKRDRLKYIYDQNKAKALKEAMPNPIGLLTAVSSSDFKKLAASAIYMALDSYSSYKAFNAELDSQYLQDGWELDDEEADNIHDSRKRAFMFMLDIVREEHLPGKLALNESSVEEYVTWKNNTNTYQKIQFFESQKSTYEAFGDYWLTLATCYYEHEDYEKCLECFNKYEELQADIFRKDYNLAKALPLAIVSAKEIYHNDEYVSIVEGFLNSIVNNTENTEWSLKYFAAQTYLDLYAQTKDVSYLEKAYSLTLNNVNYLVAEQRKMNSIYLNEVKEIALPKDPSKNASKEEKESVKDEQKKIKEYNKSMKEKRKTELPPVYEPLVVNCDLLFGLADVMNISSSEKRKIEGILHQNGNDLFLSEPLDNQYTFSPETFAVDAEFSKDALTIPVSCVSERSFIRVTVSDNGKNSVYEDWKVKKVERKDNNIDTFTAVFTSKECGKQNWSEKSIITVEIFDEKDSKKAPYLIKFKVSKYKKVSVLPATVEFEQV